MAEGLGILNGQWMPTMLFDRQINNQWLFAWCSIMFRGVERYRITTVTQSCIINSQTSFKVYKKTVCFVYFVLYWSGFIMLSSILIKHYLDVLCFVLFWSEYTIKLDAVFCKLGSTCQLAWLTNNNFESLKRQLGVHQCKCLHAMFDSLYPSQINHAVIQLKNA